MLGKGVKLQGMALQIWSLIQAFFFLSFLLVVTQRYQIYHPRNYLPGAADNLDDVTVIPYESSGYHHKAFFYCNVAKPERIWVMLGGNASLTLEWLPLLRTISLPNTGYLLIDYPGYGFNRGYPSKKANFDSVLQAYHALMQTLPASPPTYLLGHSLGSAVAMDVSAHLNPRAIILVSPFTSLFDMAKRVISTPWAWLLRPFLWDNYDTYHALERFHQQHPNVPITILHGDADEVVPVEMGRALAALSPDIRYQELPQIGHSLPYQAVGPFTEALTAATLSTATSEAS